MFWRSQQGAFLYIWGEEDNLKAFRFDPQSHFDTHAMKSKIRAPDGMPGGILSLSANGDRDGVIWAALPLNEDAFIKTVRGVLRAFDATTLEELWNTEAAEPDDNFSFAKYCPPSVVNGKVYLATFSDRLNIYGMRAASGPPPPISRKRPPRGLHQRRKAEKH